jgi:hypothetical protein
MKIVHPNSEKHRQEPVPRISRAKHGRFFRRRLSREINYLQDTFIQRDRPKSDRCIRSKKFGVHPVEKERMAKLRERFAPKNEISAPLRRTNTSHHRMSSSI